MINKTKIALAAVLAIGLASTAQAGEGSVDSDNNVVGAGRYQQPYSYGSAGYGYSTPDTVIVGPGYATSGPMIEDDNTGYAPSDSVVDPNDADSN